MRSNSRAIEAVRSAPAGYVVEVREPRKSRDQEERYHAMSWREVAELAACVIVLGLALYVVGSLWEVLQ